MPQISTSYKTFARRIDVQIKCTMLSVSYCMSCKVIAVGLNTLCYDAERLPKLYIRV